MKLITAYRDRWAIAFLVAGGIVAWITAIRGR